jgi:hypothetical protein
VLARGPAKALGKPREISLEARIKSGLLEQQLHSHLTALRFAVLGTFRGERDPHARNCLGGLSAASLDAQPMGKGIRVAALARAQIVHGEVRIDVDHLGGKFSRIGVDRDARRPPRGPNDRVELSIRRARRPKSACARGQNLVTVDEHKTGAAIAAAVLRRSHERSINHES